MTHPLNVLIVDDSRIFRSAIQSALEQLTDPAVKVVGSVWNGVKAIDFLKAHPDLVDLVTLDVEMPEKDGMETLREIQQLARRDPSRRRVWVLLVSAHTARGAAVTIEGLQSGAYDFITKPSGDEDNAERLKLQLAEKLPPLGRGRPPSVNVATPSALVARAGLSPRVILIATSTGGPKALAELLPDLMARTDLPILIVQHMPEGFTEHLAANLAAKKPGRVVQAHDGQAIEPSCAYIAPGGRHLLVRRNLDGAAHLLVNDQPPVNGCRPSADVLFRSAATVYGGAAIAVVLTGMGNDGTQGLGALRRAGATTIVQDEASSVVWGMPGRAVEAGHADIVLPLDQIAKEVAVLSGKR